MGNNKGLSLIELVVSLAILGIVSVAIFGFMTTSARTYANVNEDVNLQYEAQLTVNQLRDLTIDANRGIKYGLEGTDGAFNMVDANDPDKTEAKILAELEAISSNAGKVRRSLIIYNEIYDETAAKYRFPVIKISWNPETEELTYDTKTFDQVADIKESDLTKPKLMAQNIKRFRADLKNIENREVLFDMEFVVADRHYETKPTLTLRNKVIVSDNLNHIYVKPPIEKESFVKSVTIKKNGVSIDTDTIPIGSAVPYEADVQVQFGADKSVKWTLTGSNCDPGDPVSEISQTGVVSVSMKEKADSLLVTATSVADATKQDTLLITVQKVIIPPHVLSMEILQTEKIISPSGSGTVKEYRHEASMTYYKESEMPAGEKGVVWECKGVRGGAPSAEGWFFNTTTGILTVRSKANGTTFSVKATTKGYNSVGDKIVKVKTFLVTGLADPSDTEPKVRIYSFPRPLNRGTGGTLRATVTGMVNPTLKWEVINYTGFDDSKPSKEKSKIKISKANDWSDDGYIECAGDLSWENDFSVTVQVTATNKEGKRATDWVEIPIGRVAINCRITPNTPLSIADFERTCYFTYDNLVIDKVDNNKYVVGIDVQPYYKDKDGVVHETEFKWETISFNKWQEGFKFQLSSRGIYELSSYYNGGPDRVQYFTVTAYARLKDSGVNVISNTDTFDVIYDFK